MESLSPKTQQSHFIRRNKFSVNGIEDLCLSKCKICKQELVKEFPNSYLESQSDGENKAIKIISKQA